MTLKYNAFMDKITVTPEMKERITANVLNNSNTSFFNYRVFAYMAACGIVAFALLSVNIFHTDNFDTNTPQVTYSPGGGNYNSLGELSAAMGFDVKNAEYVPFDVNQTIYSDYGFGLAEVNYIGNENSLTLRMANDSGDVSGNYNSFTTVKTVGSVTLKGNDGSYSLALWENKGYSYSVDLLQGVDEKTLIKIVNSVN